MGYAKTLFAAYMIICTALVSIVILLTGYGAFVGRTMRAQLPNGTYVNRAHPFSDQIVLRAPNGNIVVRDLVHVLFNEDYVAGEFYETPYSTERFLYKVGNDRALRNLAGEDPFDKMLADSGLAADWPWGPEDPTWLDWRRLSIDYRYKRFWYE